MDRKEPPLLAASLLPCSHLRVQGLIIAIGAIADTCPGLNEGRGGVLGRLDDAGRAAGAAGADGTMMDVLAGISEGDAGSPEVPGADGKLAPNPGT